MMTMTLVGLASTQSRGRRPLPPSVVRAVTLEVSGVTERVRFYRADESTYECDLLSWIGGQAGLLWGGPDPLMRDEYTRSVPPSIMTHISHSLSHVHGAYGHAAEYALADTLADVYAGMLTSSDVACRFFQSGGEACAAAVRIARAATGRDAIATQGYHGAATDFAHEPEWAGYPLANLELHRRFEFGDEDAGAAPTGMKAAAQGAACIMVEVPAWDDEAAIAAFLRDCRKTADEYGIPFIIDDVVGGFRFALAGTCERYGVKADMVVLGKALSAIGGVSAIVGRADLVGMLADNVFYSTTFGGNPGPCAVAAATVHWLSEHQAVVYGPAGHLRTIGRALKDGLNAQGFKVVGQPERSILQFDTNTEWLEFCSRMIEQGVMMHRPNFPCLAHNVSHVVQTLRAAEAVSDRLTAVRERA